MKISLVLSEKLYSSVFLRWFTYLRPLNEFRVGGFSLREILKILGYEVYYESIDKLYEKYISKKFNIKSFNKLKNKDFIYLNNGLIGSIDAFNKALKMVIELAQERPLSFYIRDKLLGLYIPNPDMLNNIDFSRIKKVNLPVKDIFLIQYPWEIPEYNIYLIKKNRRFLINNIGFDRLSEGVYVYGNPDISSHTFFDKREGPIFIYDAKSISGFTMIKGPSIIREGTYLNGGKISDSTIGPVCKIGGEISESLVNGFSNMQHHSYIGHSYIGEWVNIGAGTVFSDLKNTYGTVRVSWEGRKYDTGRIKVGSFVGDHVKFSINSSIFAGKLIGPFSHVYGLLTNNVPPFTVWNGYNKSAYVLNSKKASVIAARVYSRRNVRISRIEKEWIEKLFKLTDSYRKEYGVKEGEISF